MRKLAIVTISVVLLLTVCLVWLAQRIDAPTPAEQLAEYEAALSRTADMSPPAGSEAERAAIEGIREFFSDVRVESVRRLARRVYAEDAYFNDTLKTLHGATAIEQYFLHTAENAESVTVEFVDISRSGTDYYFRWRMSMRVKGLGGGEPLHSFGMTHFRFNRAGQVVLHQDFWDAAGGLYEHLPLIGTLLRAIRARL